MREMIICAVMDIIVLVEFNSGMLSDGDWAVSVESQ